MNYQRVVRRSALSGVYTPCRIRIERRCAEPVNGLGRECDKSALPYYLRCPLDILLALGIEQQCVFYLCGGDMTDLCIRAAHRVVIIAHSV